MSAGLPSTLAAEPSFHLLTNGEEAFARVLARIDGARRRVVIRAFHWRDDETGELVGRALLRAAERGVQIEIHKDRVGMHYEYFEGNKQSFFHKKIGLKARLATWLLMASYAQWGSLRQKASEIADALLRHPNVSIAHEHDRYDHSKLYVFDDEVVILGGMGIGDDFRLHNVDFMVEIAGPEAAARLADRHGGRAAFDPERSFDYLLRTHDGLDAGELARERLALIARARKSLTIEMAYLGDPTCTDAIVDAVRRGVTVTMLTAAKANVIGDLNLWTCAEILRRTGSPANLRIFLHPRMVHGKAIVGDGEWVDVGSTNFTALSHHAYEEVDVFSRDAGLARAVEAAIERDLAGAEPARLPVKYRRIYAVLEKAISRYQSRRAKGPRRGIFRLSARGRSARRC
jgi:cardiolipin synthase